MIAPEKETISSLKGKLKILGAKISGPKSILQNRLNLWKENKLDRKLVSFQVIPSESQLPFPSIDQFSPIKEIPKKILKTFTLHTIQEWFEKRSSTFSLTSGRKLFLRKFVKAVSGFIHGSNCIFLRCYCSAEKKKNTNYEVRLVINTDISNPSIQQATCQCPAGEGFSSSCKHIAALAFFAEHYGITGESIELMSCTSELQMWHKPSGGRKAKPETVDNMLKSHFVQKPSLKSTPVNVNHLLDINCLANILCNAHCPSPVLDSRRINVHAYLNDHSYIPNLASEIMNNLNYESNRNALEKKTMKQHKCKIWQKKREKLLTASIAGSVARTVRCGNYSEGIAARQINPKSISHVKSVKWGVQNEKVAIRKYCEITNNEVSKCGIFIDKTHSFLGASPDAITNDKELIIEVKCPYSIRFQEPTDATYLVKSNGPISLNRSHSYYFQCQMQLHITEIERCDFVVWTTKGIYIENIRYDKQFCCELLVDLKSYYDQVFSPMSVKKLWG